MSHFPGQRRLVLTWGGILTSAAFAALVGTLWLSSGRPTPSFVKGAFDGRDGSPASTAGETRDGDDSGAKSDEEARAEAEAEADPDTPATAKPTRTLPRDALPIYATTQTRREVQEDLLAGKVTGHANITGAWDYILLARYLAIDDFVDRYSSYYGTDFIWQLAAYCSESIMDPLAKGPDVDGDKGLGQVAKESERIGRMWAADPSNLYYVESYDPSRSVWDPETNVILSTITLRSLYALPVVTSNAIAYGHLTVGLSAVDSSGNLTPRAAGRVERAAGFVDKLVGFVGLKLAYAPSGGGGSEAARESAESTFVRTSGKLTDHVVRDLLAIDRANADGSAISVALRDYFLGLAKTANGPWNETMYLGEAVNLARVVDDIYDIPSGVAWKALRERAEALAPAVYASGDTSLISFFAKIESNIPG